MVGRIFSTLITAAVAGAIGYGTGVYLTPPDKADEFRAIVNSKLDAITNAIPRKRAAIEPAATMPLAPEISAAQPEAAPTQIQSEAPALPRNDAPSGDASIQKDIPENNPIAPIAPQGESNNSQLAPALSAESAAPVPTATPPSAEIAESAPVTKPHVKAPAKKAKPKKKPAPQHPKAEPDTQTPAEEPAQ